MSSASNGEPRRYHISISGAVSQRIKAEGHRALLSNQLTEFIAALRVIDARLRADPFGFGELTGGGAVGALVYHTGTVTPISVQFAIDKKNAVVYIRAVTFNPA